jgi:hypothetical protein
LRLVVRVFDSDRRLHFIVSGIKLVAAVAWGPSADCSRLTVFAFAAKALSVFLGYPLGKDLSASPAALFGLECSPVDFVLHFNRLRLVVSCQRCCCRRVYINRPAKQRSTPLPIKISKFSQKHAFRQRKR